MDEEDVQGPVHGPHNTPRDRHGRPLYRHMPVHTRQLAWDTYANHAPNFYQTNSHQWSPVWAPSRIQALGLQEPETFILNPHTYHVLDHDWLTDGDYYDHDDPNGPYRVAVEPLDDVPYGTRGIYRSQRQIDASVAYGQANRIQNAYMRNRQARRDTVGRLTHNHHTHRPALPPDVLLNIMQQAGVGPTQHERRAVRRHRS